MDNLEKARLLSIYASVWVYNDPPEVELYVLKLFNRWVDFGELPTEAELEQAVAQHEMITNIDIFKDCGL